MSGAFMDLIQGNPEIVGLIGLGILALLLLLRMPVGLSLILVSFTGIYILLGARPAWGILTSVPYQFAAKWTLSSVPMFLLMGYVCYHGGHDARPVRSCAVLVGCLARWAGHRVGLRRGRFRGCHWLVGGLRGSHGPDRRARDDARRL